jgi:hypothetical protein
MRYDCHGLTAYCSSLGLLFMLEFTSPDLNTLLCAFENEPTMKDGIVYHVETSARQTQFPFDIRPMASS